MRSADQCDATIVFRLLRLVNAATIWRFVLGGAMLNVIERRSEIVRQAESKGKVVVEELARQLNVSQVTIRNDLNVLNNRGLVVRSRGGAVASTRLTFELSVQEKYLDNFPRKRRLGRAVAKLICGNTRNLVLDSGTTTEEVAVCLREHSNLTVMTNGLNVATALAPAEGIKVLLTGGHLRKKSMSFYGKHAEESLRYLHFDKCILGADGIDPGIGITTHFDQEASLNRIMCRMADEIILVADSSKFGKRGSHIICGLSDINTLVTDAGIPGQMAQALAEAGVDVLLVDDTS